MELIIQRAFLAALILGPLAGLVGVFVTARRLAFFSDTIAHAALAGIALGFAFGFRDPTLPMLLFSLAVAATIFWLKERTELLSDTIMALLLSGSVALGMVIFSQLKGRRNELEQYLFGDILSVGWSDIGVAAGLAVAVGATLLVFFNRLVLLTVSEDLAHVAGVGVQRLNLIFILLLTSTVSLAIRLLGIILVTSLIVIPPSIARNLSVSLKQQLLFSILAGLVGGVGGFAISCAFNVPSGPTITLTLIALFIVSFGMSRVRARRISA